MFFKNLSRKFKFDWNQARTMGTLHEDVCTCMTISHQLLLRMRNVSDKICRENQNMHFMFNIFFSQKSCCLCNNMEKYSTARLATYENIIWRMRFACWITTATNTCSEYAIHISFPWQQWLHERASVLRYTYLACLVLYGRAFISLIITL
jgi:hypothetical protein